MKTPTAIGSGGAAATVDVLATDAAIDMLRKGGNAVDATVAAAGVLGVTEPFSAGIGGGGFMVIRTPRGKVTTIDGRETAPAAMQPDSFIENGAPLPFNDARWSGLSAGVPGTVATWEYALERYGTKSLEKTLESGIDVARRGFRSTRRSSTRRRRTSTTSTTSRPRPRSISTPTARRGRRHDAAQPGHGEGVRDDRPLRSRGFYRGPIAKAIAAAASNPPIAPTANHMWRPGLITESDIAATGRSSARRPQSTTRASTSGAWARRRAAARASARR